MEFRCFNGVCNCNYCGSCHSEFKARTNDEKRKIYNQALEDFEKCLIQQSEEGWCGMVIDTEGIKRIKEQLRK